LIIQKKGEFKMKVINKNLKVYSKSIQELTKEEIKKIKVAGNINKLAMAYSKDIDGIVIFEESPYFDILKDFVPNYIAINCVKNYLNSIEVDCKFIDFIDKFAKNFKYVP